MSSGDPTFAFSASGTSVTLTVGATVQASIPVSGGVSENHRFVLLSTGTVIDDRIQLLIRSTPETHFVALNQLKLTDLSNDNLDDISFKFTGISGNTANIVIFGLAGFGLPDTVNYAGTEIEAFNFPNPFNANSRGFLFTGTKTVGQQTLRAEGSTAIRYALPSNLGAGPVNVSLVIYDVAGDLVRRLNFDSRATGKYHYGDWDGRNEDGQNVASGVYVGRLTIEGSSRTKTFKMAVIK